MTLRLVIEHSAHPQQRQEVLHPGGELSIGRGTECSWQLDDPEMYVSRKHCVITGEAGRFIVTDASRGGLFIDGKDSPLGPGNSAALETGMRLRLGDIVIRVEIEQLAAAPSPRTQAPAKNRIDSDDFFSQPIIAAPPVQRPEGLPQPFDSGTIDARHAGHAPEKPVPPPMFDDPFNLDRTTPHRPAGGVPEPIPARTDDFSFGSFFDEPVRQKPAIHKAPDHSWDLPAEVTPTPLVFLEPSVTDDQRQPPVEEHPAGSASPVDFLAEENRTRTRGVIPSPQAARVPQPTDPIETLGPAMADHAPLPANVQTDPAVSDFGLRDAFFKGLGLDSAPVRGSDSSEEMEALGRRFRLMVEGLMVMMHTRAKEKQNARVAQTIIGSVDVNPLKFLASTNEVLAALITPRGAGYLPPDDAINGAFRDLADHQMRTWVAMQSALRRMIDRFDPTAIENELVQTGVLQSLLSGGRNAKLWQLYIDRYKDIARSAEDRFLGEVGADFRDAYEGNRRNSNET
jgi:type VI secretion system protein ImpI